MAKEYPIIFSPPMVRAMLEGRKTQTRRIIRIPKWIKPPYDDIQIFHSIKRPRQVGDLLYVRETWGYHGCCTGGDPEENYQTVKYHADGLRKNIHFDTWDEMKDLGPRQNIKHKETCDYDKYIERWRCTCVDEWWKKKRKIPSIHMPKWAARLWLKITNIRIERVQDITEEDAIREGVPRFKVGKLWTCCATQAFEILWDLLNKPRGHGWDKNDYVWVYDFEKIEK